MIRQTLAKATVSDLTVSERWYQQVFGTPLTHRPMDGLVEWRFGAGYGVQVLGDALRAGGGTVVVGMSDLDEVLALVDAGGVDHPAPTPGGGGLLIPLTDPDGNRRFERRLDAPVERVRQAYADVGRRSQWSVPEGELVA